MSQHQPQAVEPIEDSGPYLPGSVVLLHSRTGTAYQRFVSDGLYHGTNGKVLTYAQLAAKAKEGKKPLLVVHETTPQDLDDEPPLPPLGTREHDLLSLVASGYRKFTGRAISTIGLLDAHGMLDVDYKVAPRVNKSGRVTMFYEISVKPTDKALRLPVFANAVRED